VHGAPDGRSRRFVEKNFFESASKQGKKLEDAEALSMFKIVYRHDSRHSLSRRRERVGVRAIATKSGLDIFTTRDLTCKPDR
jgi:hypothetical protein